MFQFPRFAFVSYVFRHKYLLLISANPRLAPQRPCGPSSPRLEITEIEGGFPHSEILGSKLVRSSPRLNAAYHVLHRLSAPRHPPNTLKALDCSHYQCPHTRQNVVCAIALRHAPSMNAMRSRTLIRKTSLLRKIGPIATRSSLAKRIIYNSLSVSRLITSAEMIRR